MSTPDQPDAPDTASPGPDLSKVIDIRHWLARQSGRIPATPTYLVDWLHEQIAIVAADPELTRLARLSHAEEHLRRFGSLLDTAIDGWESQDLNGEELLELYALGGQFRAELHATAGIAAYTAARADPPCPATPTWRRRSSRRGANRCS